MAKFAKSLDLHLKKLPGFQKFCSMDKNCFQSNVQNNTKQKENFIYLIKGSEPSKSLWNSVYQTWTKGKDSRMCQSGESSTSNASSFSDQSSTRGAWGSSSSSTSGNRLDWNKLVNDVLKEDKKEHKK